MIEQIGKKIKYLRENEKKITQEELAKDLNVGRETVARWENGTRDLKTDAIIQLSNYFGVTSDYLLGISDYKTAQAADIGTLTGLSEDNIKWLNVSIYGYNKHPNPAQKKFFDILNSLLDTLREHSVIYTLMHLYVQTKIFKNAFKRIENNIGYAAGEVTALFSKIQNINAEKENIVDILTHSLQNIIGYSSKEYRYYCNNLGEYSVTYSDWGEDLDNAEELMEIERFYRQGVVDNGEY